MADHKAEQYKGRAKEATGDLTGDEEKKREGKADQASGQFKEKAEEATDKVDEATDKVRGMLRDDER